MAKEYMKNADHFWILAPITRAISDKIAHGRRLSQARIVVITDAVYGIKTFWVMRSRRSSRVRFHIFHLFFVC